MTGAPRYRKPSELARLGGRHAVVEASAGTGKTYLLEHLVVDLLLSTELELPQILVVTFTEKATAELVQRIRGKLRQLVDLRSGDPSDQRAEGAPDQDCWVIDERARRKLRAALSSFDRATIATIHGFCQRVLKEFAFLQGRLFDEETIEETEAFHAAFVEALRRDVTTDPELAPYVEAWRRAGKSFEQLERILRDVHTQWSSLSAERRARALRPNRFESAELARTLRDWVRVDPENEKWRGEFKTAGIHANSVTALSKKLGLVSNVVQRCLSDGHAAQFLVEFEAMEAKNKGDLTYIRTKLDEAAPTPELQRLARSFATLYEAAPPLTAVLTLRLLPVVRARLEARKRDAGLYDFQDMLTLVAESLAGEGAQQRALLGWLRDRYPVAIIDEFQDTDEVQWSIFRRLFLEVAGHPRPQVLTVIGDPKQAIYRFRGGDVQTYLKARDEIVGAGGARVPLVANFRSTGPLIEAYNALLDQRAPAPFFCHGSIAYDQPVSCGRPDLALVDESGHVVAPVQVLALESAVARPRVGQLKRALLARMMAEVRALLDGPGRLHLRLGDQSRPLRESDLFVLTRSNRESREVGKALRLAGIPFAFFKQEKLFATLEAREVLDLLRAIVDPDDRTARGRAWITGFFGLSLPDLAGAEHLPADHVLMRTLTDWKALAEAGRTDRLFASIVEDSGIIRRELFFRDGERQLTNYLHILEILQEEAARTHATIRDLAQTLSAYVLGKRQPPGQSRDVQRLESDGQAVQVMTIHQSKGLEAAVVFLYGGLWLKPYHDVRVFHDSAGNRVIRAGRPPQEDQAAFRTAEGDEERRLYYVALTRAKGRLYLPHYPKGFPPHHAPYEAVNDRLTAILGDESTPAPARRLFSRVSVPCPVPASPLPPVLSASTLAAWQPALEPADDAAEKAAFERIAQTRAGFLVTSYSAIKRLHGGFVPAAPDLDRPAALDEAAAAPEAGGPSLGADELSRGRLSGSFLHEILEAIPLDGLRDAPALEDWRARPAVQALFERLRRRHDRNPAHVPHAQKMVHTALTTPVRLGTVWVPGLAAVDNPLREMEFLYPIPERAQPLLGASTGGRAALRDEGTPWRVERGLVKGFIDYLFEHAGRIYVCDWKGDWLPAWEETRVAAHCDRNYAIQASLYTLAALRLGAITGSAQYDRIFGGVLYCFLRGMRPNDPTSGVYFRRPDWQEVVAWEQKMLGEAYWRAS